MAERAVLRLGNCLIFGLFQKAWKNWRVRRACVLQSATTRLWAALAGAAANSPPAGASSATSSAIRMLTRRMDAQAYADGRWIRTVGDGGAGPRNDVARLPNNGARIATDERVATNVFTSFNGFEEKRFAVPADLLIYLNRLGDLLFVLARVINRRAGVPDVLWGGSGR